MDDAQFVRRFQRLGDLPRDGCHVRGRDRSLFEAFGKGGAVDELEHEPRRDAGVLEAIDVADVRVVERCQQLRLAPEAGQPIRIGGKRTWQDLQGDVAIELGVAGPIHLAHTAGAKDADDLVGPHEGANREGHECRA